jgi:hypothetical protein
MMKPCKFTFDDTPAFDGFSHGSKWNGFDNVAVTPEVLGEIAVYFRKAGDQETCDMLAELILDPMEDGLISLGWGYATSIVHPTRYIVRDVATKGADFLMWGDDDIEAAQETLRSALADGLEVELVTMPADDMDKWTAKLIGEN